MKKNIVTSRNIFILILLSILLFLLCRNEIRKQELISNHVFSKGKIIKVDFGSNNGGGIMYEIEGFNSAKLAYDNVGGSKCESHIYSLLDKIQKNKFPVVYDPSDLSNSKILIFEHQYRDLNIEVPNDLKQIIKELSICQK